MILRTETVIVSGGMKVECSWRFEIPSSSAPCSSTSSYKALLPSSRFLPLASAEVFWQFHQTMPNTRKCKACGRPFEIDRRNADRHSCCSDAACQRARRALAQARRRVSQRTKTKLTAASRLQRGVKPTEADLLAEHPALIGLLSMLTGSSDLQELKIVFRRLSDRGRDILGFSHEMLGAEFQTARF